MRLERFKNDMLSQQALQRDEPMRVFALTYLSHEMSCALAMMLISSCGARVHDVVARDVSDIDNPRHRNVTHRACARAKPDAAKQSIAPRAGTLIAFAEASSHTSSRQRRITRRTRRGLRAVMGRKQNGLSASERPF